jgi:hypothetical protein
MGLHVSTPAQSVCGHRMLRMICILKNTLTPLLQPSICLPMLDTWEQGSMPLLGHETHHLLTTPMYTWPQEFNICFTTVERGEEGAAPALPPSGGEPAPLPVILAAILQVPPQRCSSCLTWQPAPCAGAAAGQKPPEVGARPGAPTETCQAWLWM